MTNNKADAFAVLEISEGFRISIDIGIWVALLILLALLCPIAFIWLRGWMGFGSFELDRAEIGFGKTKVSFTPNRNDRQIAYKIWVELSTRKIGLKIDPKHDVISEVYDSWYKFFNVTRELIKEVPAHKLKSKSTREIVKVSVHVLNDGLRPHLTCWQARYRVWYKKKTRGSKDPYEPQDIQKNFPAYKELVADLLEINARLIRYREIMFQLATGGTKNMKEIDPSGNANDWD